MSKRQRPSPSISVQAKRHSPSHDEFWDDVRLTLRDHDKPEALVYVHGFNMSMNRALRRAAHLHYSLNVKGVTLAFCWPSQNNIMNYERDERTVDALPPQRLASCIRALQRAGAGVVHIVAHSMGSRLAVRALAALASDKRTSHTRLGQVVFAAADIHRDEFVRSAPAMSSLAKRTTLYSSSRDSALEIARWCGREEARAGDARPPLVIDTIDTVDTTRASDGLIGHSDFDGTGLDDLRALIWFNLAPEHRVFLSPSDKQSHWEFEPISVIQKKLGDCRTGFMLSRLAGCDLADSLLDKQVRACRAARQERRQQKFTRAKFYSNLACGGKMIFEQAGEA